MKFPIVLGVATTMLFAAGTSVASAQLSSRSAKGGLFNSLVDWNPIMEEGLLGAGDVRMSPWAPNRVELGTVRPADPNRPWMGYWGHTQDKELADVIGAEHSLNASPIALSNAASRRSLFVPDAPTGDANVPNVVTEDDQGENEGNPPMFQPDGSGFVAPVASNVTAADVIINPEPSVYWLAAVGLVLIALIRRYRMA
jgi:hypothetical protein